MKKTKVWPVAVVWALVGLLLGYIIGASGLLPFRPISNTETVQTINAANTTNEEFIGVWKHMSKTDSYILTINEDGSVTYDKYWYEDLSERRTGVLRGDSIVLTKSTEYSSYTNEDGTTEVETSAYESTLDFNVSLSDDGVLLLSRENGFTSSFVRDTEY